MAHVTLLKQALALIWLAFPRLLQDWPAKEDCADDGSNQGSCRTVLPVADSLSGVGSAVGALTTV